MDISVIKSYLVELGFKVDNRQLNAFNEGMRKAALIAAREAGNITKGFLVAGTTITGVLASITAGTIGMMAHVADADLDMQVFARRMYLSVDAARKMKMATDALGYSIEDIVWGPPELAERYRQLIKDQNKMLAALGGADFEKQMRNLRDVRFEFTRLGIEMRYFTMLVVADLSKALFGDEDSLLNKLRQFSDWFMSNMPRLANAISEKVAPALHDMGKAAAHLWETLSRVDWGTLLSDLVKITTVLIKVLDFIVSHPALMKILGFTAGGAAIGSIVPGVGTALGAGAGLFGGLGYELPGLFTGEGGGKGGPALKISEAAKIAAQRIAAQTGINPAWLYGQFVHETGGFTNRGATMLNNLAGIRMPGSTEYRKFATIQDFADFYSNLIKRNYPGALGAQTDADYFRALKSGGYYEDSYENYLRGARRGEAQYRPMSLKIDVGGINVHVNQPNATPEQIHKAVGNAVSQKLKDQAQVLLVQRQGVYA